MNVPPSRSFRLTIQRWRKMKEIEIIAGSEKDAIDFAVKQFRMPREAFEVVGSFQESAPEGSPPELRFRLRMKLDTLIVVTRERVVELLKQMGIMAEVRIRPEKEFFHVDIHSESGSLLIGKRGETLDAIQHLTNRMISRSERDMPLILVDVENYRERVNRRLKKIALSAAEKVGKTGQPVELEPMTPTERKFIHKLLSEVEGIDTYSMGREGQRRIIVSLENAPRSTSVGDEEILPELLNDITNVKRQRPLDQRTASLNNKAKPSNSSDASDDLMEPEPEKDAQ